MAVPIKPLATALMGLVCFGALAESAQACNCGCSLPGSGAELTSVAGASSLFAADAGNFLVQTTLSARDVTGSFNESGAWSAKPLGSSLHTFQANFGLTYYPGERWTLGLLVPLAANSLNGAQWAAQGAIVPIDTMDGQSDRQFGGGFGDVSLNTSYVAYRSDGFWPSLALWGGLLLPTGNAAGSVAATYTGSGIFSGQIGLSGLKQLGPVELSAGLGYQRPLSEPTTDVSTAFYVGQSVLGQLQANWEVIPSWRLGLGASAFYGEVAAREASPTASNLGKLKLTPSVDWQFMEGQGVRFAYGADPAAGPWINAMTDRNYILTYYRFL